MVKGLVIDHIQKLRSGRAVLNSRICRASYAIELDEPYDSERHKGQEIYTRCSGVVYVRDQLYWRIRKVYYLRHFEAFKCADQTKGEAIDPGKSPECVVDWCFKADRIREWDILIYMSYNEPASLPTYSSHGKSSFRDLNAPEG